MKHWLSRYLCSALSALLFSTGANASLHISIAEPEWQLLLNNDALAQRSASLRPNEQSFSRQLQPLLQAKRYNEIARLFAQRPLADDSPALQVLRGQILMSLQRFADAETALQAAIA